MLSVIILGREERRGEESANNHANKTALDGSRLATYQTLFSSALELYMFLLRACVYGMNTINFDIAMHPMYLWVPCASPRPICWILY